MKPKNRIIVVVLLVSCLFTACQINSSSLNETFTLPADQHFKVLFISSYDPGFPTFTLQVDGLKAAFENKHILLDVEFMDTKRFPEEKNLDNFYQSLSYKLDRTPPYDAIIVGDDNAFLFALDHQEDLFSDIPIVFFGVNDQELALAQDQNPNVTGAIEAVSMEETIDLLLSLHPDTTQVVALVDETSSGQGDLKTFFEIAQTKNNNISLEALSLSDFTFNEYKQELQNLDTGAVLLLLSLYVDKNGEVVSFYDGLELVTKNTNQPIYSLWYHGLGDGVVGGKVINHYDLAQTAADMVIQIFQGSSIQDMKVITYSENNYVFDYEKLKDFDIKMGELPPASVLINEPRSLLYQYRNLVIAAASFVLVQSFIIAALIGNIMRRKEMEKNLVAEQNLLEKRVQERTVEIQKVNAELIEADRAKDTFLANMSHELRTPLTAVLGLSEILQEQISGPLNERQLKYVNTIEKSGTHLLNLINDILDISKIRVGNLGVDLEYIELEDICRSSMLFVEQIANGKNIELRFDNRSSISGIQADRRMVKQILVNLLSNAIKFTPQDGHVGMALKSDTKQDNIHFEIWDDGIGIAPEKQNKVFEPFYQVDSSMTRNHEGAGLGLALVSHFVALHQGTIICQSEGIAGKGSCFIVTLPVSPEEVVQQEE